MNKELNDYVFQNSASCVVRRFDFVAVFLLLKHRTLGVWFTLVLMLSNVVINSIALYSLEVITEAWPLQFQTLFFGFFLGSAYLLLRQGLAYEPSERVAKNR